MGCSPPGSSSWDYPGKNTGMGYHFFLEGIFPTQVLNPHLNHIGRQILYHWATREAQRRGGKIAPRWVFSFIFSLSEVIHKILPSPINNPFATCPPNQPITSTELRSPLHPRSEKLLTFVGDTCVIRPHSLHSHYSLPKTSVTRSLDSRGLEKEGFTEPPHYSPVFWWPVFFEHLPYLCMGSWALPPKGLWPYFWKLSAICSPEIRCVRITDIPGPRGYQMQVLPSQNRCAINIFLLHGSVYLLRSCH